MSTGFLRSIGVGVGLSLLLFGGILLADGEGHGRSSQLTPPDGAPFPEARGSVVLNKNFFIVNVEGLAVGDYTVLLDDGTGTKAPIGTITVKLDDEVDEGDDPAGGGDHDGDVDDESEPEGTLKLSGDKLPFGATSPIDLGGRDIAVADKDNVVVLAGKTPALIPNEPEQRNGMCPLARPDPAVDEDAEGVLKLESGEGRIVIKVHLENLEPGKVYEVVISKPDDSASESLGKVTINEGGNGQFKVDSAKGDPIPFGAGDLAALKGYKVAVKDEAGAAVLIGTICDAQVRPPEGDGDHHENPKPRCFTAALDGAQEVPPVTTDAKGTGRFELGGRDALKLEYELKLEGLSGPATAAGLYTGAAGATGELLVALDATALMGEIPLTAEQSAAIRTGATYVNISTAANANGEIRGQLAVCPDDDEDDDDDDHLEPPCATAALDGAQEVPPVTTEATGTGEFELGGRDKLKLEYELKVEGLSGPATAAGIYAGAAGATGELLVALDATALKGEITLTAEQSAAIRTGDTYVNILTAANPTGEIRGQLVACPDDDEDEDDDDDEGETDEPAGGGGAFVSEEPMFLMVGEFDTLFLRGDSNQDGAIDLSDTVKVLNYLFIGDVRPYCLDAADANDDGSVDISDAIGIVAKLFMGGDDFKNPGTLIPGSDPTPDNLYCVETP